MDPARFRVFCPAPALPPVLAPVLVLVLAMVLALPAPVLAQDQDPSQDRPLVREKLPPAPKRRFEPPTSSKFPNKDTAKNRKDTAMGTREPKGTISIDEDEDAKTMNVIPAKKKTQQEDLPPIYVQPQIKVKP